jgi:RNA polymerase sigma-70 factor (ECF subfamily)
MRRNERRSATGEDAAVDAALVRQLVEGSSDALATLYDRHSAAVFATVTRATDDRSIAADVVQETFLGLWNQAERYEQSRGSLRAWLLTIARNRAIDHIRAQRRHEPAIAFSSFEVGAADDTPIAEWLTASGRALNMGSPADNPEIAVSTTETQARIAEEIRLLPPVERFVIELAYAEELSQSEMAIRLSWPIGTVKTRTRRALRHLREGLESRQLERATRREDAPRLPKPVLAGRDAAASCA